MPRLDDAGQTSIEYLLIVAGVVLLALIVGYIMTSGAVSVHKEINSVETDIFD